MKRLLLVPIGAALIFAGAACTPGNNFRDVEGIPSHDADSYSLWNNLDGFPNIVRVCTDGVAFATTTRDYTAIMRVPEWDVVCQAAKK